MTTDNYFACSDGGEGRSLRARKEAVENRRGPRLISIPMSDTVDMHTHTWYSDGALSPADLVRRARERGITHLSITDHDSIDGLPEARIAGAETGVEIVPGVELSATLGSKDIHILGYLFDPDNDYLKQTLDLFKRERFSRAARIVRKLNQLDLPLSFDSVLERAGHGAIGRPHIAEALVIEGFTSDYVQAFDHYIGDSGPAYEPKYRISPEDAVDIIANAGGVSILAHPGWYITEDELVQLIRAGLDGIETVHPAHDAGRRRFYSGIASTYFLLESGGSDYHGGRRNDDAHFGTQVVSIDVLKAMRRRLFIQ
jgi:predicted metal-dependent phosphoesterase TrpH